MSHAEVQFISTKTIHQEGRVVDQTTRQIDLTPWDLKYLRFKPVQMGLLFHKPHHDHEHQSTTSKLIDRLETSLSLTLDQFYPLAGRLAITTHEEDNNTVSVHIDCNNAGAEFIHTTAHVTVAEILSPLFVPRIVRAFFPLNGTINYDGRHGPLLAVQVTELLDGIFLGIAANHVVVDGTSFWHFVNSWSQISRTGSAQISNPPLLQPRWLPNETHDQTENRPIRIPINFSNEDEDHQSKLIIELEERVFHFSKESIARLKAKANAEQLGTDKQKRPINISSLQSLLAHIWVAVTRARGLGYDEETSFMVLIGNRARLVPPLPDEYFGCAINARVAVAKAGELLERGLGWAAMVLNQAIAAHNDASIHSSWESWVKKPVLLSTGLDSSTMLVTQNSPRFSIYGNDFGWGVPMAVRSGFDSKIDGTITVHAGGVEEGSMDFELCLSTQALKAMGEDAQFMDAISALPSFSPNLYAT